MTNILVAYDRLQAEQYDHAWWHLASGFFGRKLHSTILTLAIIKPDREEDLVDAIRDTAETLISYRLDDEDWKKHQRTPLLELERERIIAYLYETYKACNPYMPDTGTLQYHSHVMSDDELTLYLVIKHFGEKEYPGKAFPRNSLRVSQLPY